MTVSVTICGELCCCVIHGLPEENECVVFEMYCCVMVIWYYLQNGTDDMTDNCSRSSDGKLDF